jgi:hypothetical protein
MDHLQEALLIGGLLPFGITLVVLGVVLGASWEKRTRLRQTVAAGTIGLSLFTAYALLAWTVLTPEESWQWLPYLCLAAAAVGMLTPWVPWLVRPLLLAGLASAAGRWLMPELEDLAAERLSWQLTLGGSVFLTGLLTEVAMRLRPHQPWGACWCVFFLAVATQMEFAAGSGKFLQLAGLVAAPLAAVTLLELKRSWRGLLGSSAPLLAVAGPGLLLLGKLNSATEVTLASYAWVCAGPLVFSLLVLLPERLGWKRTVLAFSALLGCLGWGVYSAVAVTGLPQM